MKVRGVPSTDIASSATTITNISNIASVLPLNLIQILYQMKVENNTNDDITTKNSKDNDDDNEQHQNLENNNLNVIENQQDYLFRCAICGTAEGDSSNLSSSISLQTNATVRCGHQL